MKAFVNKKYIYWKIYIQKTVSVQKKLGPAWEAVLSAHICCICEGPVAILVCLVCWCALLPFCAAPHGIKGFPLCGVRRLHHVAGIFHVFVVTALSFFLVRVILDPWTPLELQTKKILSGFFKSKWIRNWHSTYGGTQRYCIP